MDLLALRRGLEPISLALWGEKKLAASAAPAPAAAAASGSRSYRWLTRRNWLGTRGRSFRPFEGTRALAGVGFVAVLGAIAGLLGLWQRAETAGAFVRGL